MPIEERRILGLDVGERRIGVALSDASARLATPLTTIGAVPQALAIERIGRQQFREPHFRGRVVEHTAGREHPLQDGGKVRRPRAMLGHRAASQGRHGVQACGSSGRRQTRQRCDARRS